MKLTVPTQMRPEIGFPPARLERELNFANFNNEVASWCWTIVYGRLVAYGTGAGACERARTRDGHSRSIQRNREKPAVSLGHRPARMMRPRFADSIRASSPSGLREQAGHMTASDFCAARYIFSCQAGAIHT